MNHISEYWYIGSMLARSVMEKKRMEAWAATGWYPLRVSSISLSVEAAISCLAVISSERVLEEERILMAVSSSRMFPCEVESTSRILSSISFSCFLFSALSRMSWFFFSSSSGFSFAATIPNN